MVLVRRGLGYITYMYAYGQVLSTGTGGSKGGPLQGMKGVSQSGR